MPSCIVRTCKNQTIRDKKESGITYHRFPRPGHEMRDAWIRFVQVNRREDEWYPSDYTVICSDHFKNDFKYITKTGRVYLKKSAVQTQSVSGLEDPLEPGSVSESIIVTPEFAPRRTQIQKKLVKKTCLSYKSMVEDMKKRFGFERQAENDLTSKAELVDLHKSLMKKAKQNRHAILYTTPLRKFAMCLHFYSPAAYKYIRRTYNRALPHINEVSRWYSSVDAKPGFTEEAFKALGKKRQANRKPVLCTLAFGEMAIKKQKLSRKSLKLGAVNFGAGPVKGEDEDTVATRALVFMLVSINENWKLPVGYFLLTSIDAEQKANLIKICLEKCHRVGVTVANLTCDYSPTNLKTAEILGCQLTDLNNLKTYFPHPSTSEKVCIFIDPCHVINLVRNTFERKRLMLDENNGQIKWQLIINLNKLQQSKSLRFAKKLRERQVAFRNLIMKIKLCTQLLSRNVGKALVLCYILLSSNKFTDCVPTSKFINLMNNFFDIINPRNNHCNSFNRPIYGQNKESTFSLLNEVKSTLLQLKFQTKSERIIKTRNRGPKIVKRVITQKIAESHNKSGIVAALICIESIKTLYNNLVEEKKPINYLSIHRLNQDHLDLFFGLIKNHGSKNNNPTVLEFRTAYKKTLNHLELRSSFSANCLPIDNFTIFYSESENIINSTLNLNRYDEEEYEIMQTRRTLKTNLAAEKNCEILAKMLNENSTHSELIVGNISNFVATSLTKSLKCEICVNDSQLIVGYISSFVATTLTKSLKCEVCVDVLTTTYKRPYHKLIAIVNMGGVCYASEHVFQICLATEKIIRQLIKESGGTSLSSKYSPTYITSKTLKLFLDKELFTSLKQHAFNQPATLNHRIHLIRAVISKYTTIRLHDIGEVSNNQTQKRKKLILF